MPLTVPQIRAAHREHIAGWSLNRLAHLRWREWGFRTPAGAYSSLRQGMVKLGLPVRSRRDATVDAHLVHGCTRRALQERDHPNHDQYKRYMAAARKRQRERKRDR